MAAPLKTLLFASLTASAAAGKCMCTWTDKDGKTHTKNVMTLICKGNQGTCAGEVKDDAGGAGDSGLRGNKGGRPLSAAAQEAFDLALKAKEEKPIVEPAVPDSAQFENKLAAIKTACAGEAKDFVPGAMCAHDQCVVEAVTNLLRDNVDIMDCKFGDSVTEMCKAAPNAKHGPWKGCPNRWAAYSNEGQCAAKGLDAYDGILTAYGGFVGQTPDDVKLKFPGDDTAYHAKRTEIVDKAAKYQFNDITSKGCAVCATVAQGGFHAYKAAGLLGRIDLIEEEYSAGIGHIFLLYSTRDEKPSSAENACPRGWTQDVCYTQFIDNWYAGLTSEDEFAGYMDNMLHPDPTAACYTGNCAIPYSLRNDYPPEGEEAQTVSWHKQNRWAFRKPRSNDDPAVAEWPKAPVPEPTKEGWSTEWYAPAQAYYFAKPGAKSEWA